LKRRRCTLTDDVTVKEALSIDKFRLDRECERQASLYAMYAKDAAEKELDRDKKRAQLDLVEAELDTDIRKDPSKYGVVKPTENAVKQAVPTQPKYKDAMKAYLDAKYEYNIVTGILEALSHKKMALPELVKLYLNDYWAKPSIPRETEASVEEGRQRQRDLLNADAGAMQIRRRRTAV
jgi:hypothetical protein